MDYESVKYVEGFVENIIFRNEDNGYTVFNIVYDDEEITCVGVLSYINTGEFITAQGEFVKHAVYYMQFKVTSYEFRAPDDAASVRRYLSSGAIKGIGDGAQQFGFHPLDDAVGGHGSGAGVEHVLLDLRRRQGEPVQRGVHLRQFAIRLGQQA